MPDYEVILQYTRAAGDHRVDTLAVADAVDADEALRSAVEFRLQTGDVLDDARAFAMP